VLGPAGLHEHPVGGVLLLSALLSHGVGSRVSETGSSPSDNHGT
jgi:hypothetical protein